MAALDQHIAQLRRKHDGTDGQLLAEQARPSPDESTVRELKRRKLKLKDEISRLQSVVPA